MVEELALYLQPEIRNHCVITKYAYRADALLDSQISFRWALLINGHGEDVTPKLM